MPRAAKPDFSTSVLRFPWAVASRSGRRSVSKPCDGEHGGERPEGRARGAGTHRPSSAMAAIDPGRSRLPLVAVSGWKLGLLITDFARFINSEIAPLWGRQRVATHGDLFVGSGGSDEEMARPLEGGFVGRGLHRLPAQRTALDPASGDRLVGTGASPRADRAVTRRRDCRPRAWGEARGPRTTRSRPLRSRRRGSYDGVGVSSPGIRNDRSPCEFLAVTMHRPGLAGRCVHSSWGQIPAGTASDAALLVSELVTNSVVHANVAPVVNAPTLRPVQARCARLG
jgi:hypothetical protein